MVSSPKQRNRLGWNEIRADWFCRAQAGQLSKRVRKDDESRKCSLIPSFMCEMLMCMCVCFFLKLVFLSCVNCDIFFVCLRPPPPTPPGASECVLMQMWECMILTRCLFSYSRGTPTDEKTVPSEWLEECVKWAELLTPHSVAVCLHNFPCLKC